MKLKGKIRVGSDKSISQRALILSSIAEGKTYIKHLLKSEDINHTMRALQMLGVNIEGKDEYTVIKGKGKFSLKEPQDVLDLGNSGTGMRLLTGLVSGKNFLTILTGDNSLRKRPMKRIVQPLRMMGAEIDGRENGRLPPLVIRGKYPLNGIEYKMPVASAQVKSAILLAGLFTQKKVEIEEPSPSRNHTEIMLRSMGVDVEYLNCLIKLGSNRILYSPKYIEIGADISSAAYFMVATALIPHSQVLFEDLILNTTRTGILDVFQMMNVNFEIKNRKEINGEKIGDVMVYYSPHIKGICLKGDIIPRIIDEIPIICILACKAEGRTMVKDALELRYKECDRIKVMVENLAHLGIRCKELPDGIIIEEGKLKEGKVDTHYDHRIAMSFAIASLISENSIVVDDTSSIKTSYPMFFEHLKNLTIP
ncbi:MAG: 3-phosphoshikimate 1-carboxyvinyltransferase [Deltaproteobacteria bacterium]|nr:3-phosphoshikimate 1-carboxyvinyltransferase [Deltaproteobacteria bacterium]